jgi:hypothetical protein
MTIELNEKVPAIELVVGDYLYDPMKSGTHGERIIVEWTGHHGYRKRTYVAGLEEHTRNPVTLAYDDTDPVSIYRRP